MSNLGSSLEPPWCTVSGVPAGLERERLESFLARRPWSPRRDLEWEVRPLRGGLESSAVLEVVARGRDGRGAAGTFSFILKRLRGRPAREAAVYSGLVRRVAGRFAPRLLDVEWPSSGRCLLYLERVRPARRWPWRSMAAAGQVLERLATLHRATDEVDRLPNWDYEGDLAANAAALLAAVDTGHWDGDFAAVRRSRAAVRRLREALPELRRQLLAFAPLGRASLHGDAHPGNVIVRRRGGADEPVLLDWGRARAGSPLEDVAAWLQSLGCWEPEARRRHDTLLGGYLAACGLSPALGRSLRDAYWLAGACNLLAGAVLHHLRVATALAAGKRAAAEARRGLLDGLRVLRRAEACWSG